MNIPAATSQRNELSRQFYMSFLSSHLMDGVNSWIQPLNDDHLVTDYYALMNHSIIILKKSHLLSCHT